MTAQSETESWTVRRLLTWTQQRFTAQSLGSPRLDAELLLGHSLGWPRIALYTKYEQALQPAELERYRGLIKRRLQGEPVAYLIGQKEFFSLALQVTEAVLIPRPETELLVEQALALLPAPGRAKSSPAVELAADAAAAATRQTADPAADTLVEREAEVEQQVPAERGVALTVHYESFAPAELPDEADESADSDPLDDADDVDAADTSDDTNASGASEITRAPAAAQVPARPVAASAAAQVPARPVVAPAAVPPVAAAATAKAPPSAQPGGSAVPPTAIVADIGTGSGAVALAIKHERPAVRVLAIDCCDAALAVAAQNAERLGLPVEFFHGDLLAPLPPSLRLDLITANLPYIPTADIATLAPEVRSEPHGALDGGPDGLAIVRRLVEAAPLRLRRGGALLLEIGIGQHLAVEALLRAAGFVDVQSHKDLAQIPRVVVGHLR